MCVSVSCFSVASYVSLPRVPCLMVWVQYSITIILITNFKMSIIHHTMCYKKKNSSPKNEYFQDVDEIVSSSDLEKCSIASVSQQWMLCSEWVPSE